MAAMKLSEMGTSGLIDYVLTGNVGRRGAGQWAAALNVIRRRHGDEGVRRFRRAVQATLSLRMRLAGVLR